MFFLRSSGGSLDIVSSYLMFSKLRSRLQGSHLPTCWVGPRDVAPAGIPLPLMSLRFLACGGVRQLPLRSTSIFAGSGHVSLRFLVSVS